MTMLALDWNATRVRAVLGPAWDYPVPAPLEPPDLDLPMAISLEKSTPTVGSKALRQCRMAAHQVCRSFLPQLSEATRWQTEGLDPRTACDLVWSKLNHLGANSQGIVLSVPGYLRPRQAETLCKLAGGLPMLGSAPTLLTAALAGHVEQFWQRSVLVIDVDEHALTLGWIKAMGDKAHLIESRSFTQLGLRWWNERLLNVLADLCVRQHRRDPRDVPQAEQSLYDQLDSLTDAALKHQAIQLGVQAPQWFKHLLVHPEETMRFCPALARQAAHEAEHLLQCWPMSEMPRCILLTQAAGRLPGLIDALHALVLPSSSADTKLPTSNETNWHDDDFGEDLMFAESEERLGILVLPAEGPARAAHGLAELFRNGSLARGHLDTVAPLPAAPPVDAGPPRLHFLGRDYLLREPVCTLGSLFGSQVHFDKSEYPAVSARHCEIACTQNEFTLHNRCREGTLVNDHPVSRSIVLRPGDCIRLGPQGPIVRFLGKISRQRQGTAGSGQPAAGSIKPY